MPIPALVGAGLIAGGASVLGSVFGFGSQQSANSTNLQATRETNETNLQLARMQNDWNVDMWNRSNEYNTYANQLQRWKDAGLNPNTFQGDTSNTQALQSAEMANQQTPQPVQAYDPSNALTQGASSFMQFQVGQAQADAALQSAKAQTEQAKTAQIMAQIQRERLPFEQSLLSSQALNLDASKTATLGMLPFQIDAQRAQALLYRSESDQAQSSKHFMDIQAMNAARQGNWIDREMMARLGLMRAQTHQADMSANLSSAQIAVAQQEAQKIWADKNLTNWDSKLRAFEYRLKQQGIHLDGNMVSSLLAFMHRGSWLPSEIMNGSFGQDGSFSYTNPYK